MEKQQSSAKANLYSNAAPFKFKSVPLNKNRHFKRVKRRPFRQNIQFQSWAVM